MGGMMTNGEYTELKQRLLNKRKNGNITNKEQDIMKELNVLYL